MFYDLVSFTYHNQNGSYQNAFIALKGFTVHKSFLQTYLIKIYFCSITHFWVLSCWDFYSANELHNSPRVPPYMTGSL